MIYYQTGPPPAVGSIIPVTLDPGTGPERHVVVYVRPHVVAGGVGWQVHIVPAAHCAGHSPRWEAERN